MSVAEFPSPSRGEARATDYDRTPPQDTAAEQSVLGAMLMSKDAIADVVEMLRGGDFYRPAHELVYDVILDLYGRGEPADAITVAGELTKRGEIARVGGAPYLHTLISTVPTAANAGYYAEIVRERAVLRRLVAAGTKIVQMGYSADGGEVDAIVDRAQAEVYSVTERRTSEDYLPLSAIMEGTLDEIEAIGSRGGQMIGVPTGFADLDQLTNGLHPGQMIVVAARPAVGKSTLGLDVARSASIKHQLASVIFSLEMSRNEITMRLLSAEAKVPLHHMRNGTMSEDDWHRLARRMGEVSSAPLFIDDSPNMSMMEIRAKCRRLKQRHDLRLVVIDYLQLMSSGKRVESRQQEVSEFSRALKLLAKELEVPVIAISQLNRGPEQRTDKKPQMSDLRESGCLTAESRVLRADSGAEVTLGELYATGARDVPVWSLDESLRYVRRHLTHVFPTGVREVFRVRLASGKSVRATANHPFLTCAGWRAIGDLAPGARVAVPRHVTAPERVADPWADAEVVGLARRLAKGARGVHLRRTRSVPVGVFGLPKQQIALFLRHLWATGGHVAIDPAGHGGDVAYSSTSRRLLDDVSLLLLRFGISVRIRPSRATGRGDRFRLELTGPEDQRRFLKEIRADSAAALASLQAIRQRSISAGPDTVPPGVWDRVREVLAEPRPAHHLPVVAALHQRSEVRERLARVATLLDAAALDIEAVNDVRWDTVVAIESDGLVQVYDATVVGTHNFIANGIAVHNSIEQDADMVILLHREELYERESPRAGEADFIVAKHRNGPTATVTVAFQGHYSRFVDMAHG